MSEERRRGKRIHLVHYLRIFDAKTGDPLGNLADITPTGLKMLSEFPLEVDKVYMLHMRLPRFLYDVEAIEFSAECVWSETDKDDPNLYATGFHAINIQETDKEIIKELIEIFMD
jgi:hypothetical protein